MSTPIDLNVVMPYGYTVGRVLDMVWQARVDGGGAHIDLPEGPCRVMASWAGPEKAVLALVTPGARTVLAEIPAQKGGGRAILGWLPSALSRATRYAWSAIRAPQPQRPAPSKSTRSQPSNHPQGGGVGDYPEHQHRTGRTANHHDVRRGRFERRRGANQRRAVRTFAGGRVDGVDYRAGYRGHCVPVLISDSFGTVRNESSERRRDGGVLECVGAQGRNSILSGSRLHVGRRGSNHHHLPAVAAGGGVR